MTSRCVFQSEGGLRWLGEPDAILTAQSLAELHRLRVRVEQALAGEYRFAAGVLPYEVGSVLQGLPAAPFTAWAYLYKEAPATQPDGTLTDTDDFSLTAPFQPEQDRQAYLSNFARIQSYLQAGDCYQVNLAQRFSAAFSGSPLNAWLALQQAHPAPHSCYFDTGNGHSLFGVSTERYLSI